MIRILRLPNTDVLVIIDCCHAAKGYTSEEIGKRKFELLASASAIDKALAPSCEGSFTGIFSDVMERLIDSPKYARGFSTSTLYREVYHHAKMITKPYLFDQSRYDYGKIWLRPLPTGREKLAITKEPDITIDLKLHLAKAPDGLMINELAKSLQYLPHVQEVDFTRLHGPEEDIKALIVSMKQLRFLLQWVGRIRRKRRVREESAAKQKGLAPKQSGSFSALLAKQHYAALYDWNSAVAWFKNGTSITMQTAPEPTSPSRRPSAALAAEERPPTKAFSVLGLFSITYFVNFPSMTALAKSLFRSCRSDERSNVAHSVAQGSVEHVSIGDNRRSSATPSPSKILIVQRVMERHVLRTTAWDVFTWLFVVVALILGCYIARE